MSKGQKRKTAKAVTISVFFVFRNAIDRRHERMKVPAVRSVPPQTPQVSTTRLDVAAYLLVCNFEITDVKLEGTTATFAFKDPDLNGDAVVRAFYNGGQAPAKEYADCQKRVRDLMWEAKRRG
jgi:hypothetical protein